MSEPFDSDELLDLVEEVLALPMKERLPRLEARLVDEPKKLVMAKELLEMATRSDLVKPRPNPVLDLAGLSQLASLELGNVEAAFPDLFRRLVRSQSSFEDFVIDPEEEPLGQGAGGRVIRAYDQRLRRYVALKVLGAGELGSRGGTRFIQEAQILAQISGPNIVPIFDLGLTPEEELYFAMPLLSDQTFHDVLRAGPAASGEPGRKAELTRILRMLAQIADAVGSAHRRGVVHRDLKPANVLLDSMGAAHVADWGLAAIQGAPAVLGPEELTSDLREARDAIGSLATHQGSTLGTPPYCAPEMVDRRDAAPGPTADVYSLGAMLYEALVGTPPYLPERKGVTDVELIQRIRTGAPRPLSSAARDAAPELVAMAARAMERLPEERYQDAGEFHEDLQAFLDQRVVSAYRTGPLMELRQWTKRNKALAASLVGGTLLAVGISTASAIVLANKNRSLVRMSAPYETGRLLAAVDDLWPATAEALPELEEWVTKLDAMDGRIPEFEEARDRLVRGSRPSSPEETAEYEGKNPGFAKRQELLDEIDALERYIEALRNGEPLETDTSCDLLMPPNFEAAVRGVDALVRGSQAQSDLAAAYAAMVEPLYSPECRASSRVDWHQALGILARSRADRGAVREHWWLALAANTKAERSAVGINEHFQRMDRVFEPRNLHEIEALLDPLREELAVIERALEAGRPLAFRERPDESSWLYSQLTSTLSLLEDAGRMRAGLEIPAEDSVIQGMTDGHGWSVERRIEHARDVKAAFAPGGEATAAWEKVLPQITARHPWIERPIPGLWPLGLCPHSGRAEFLVMGTGAAPARGQDGAFELEPGFGVVMIAIDGGIGHLPRQSFHNTTFCLPFDLDPYFISKYEMTQFQWLNLTGKMPSQFKDGARFPDGYTLNNPVEQVSWNDCHKTLGRHGMVIPTVAQWGYAARVGTVAPYTTGFRGEELEGYGNLLDDFFFEISGNGTVGWNDGCYATAAVGRYLPNRFGLHDVHGNVWEFNLDCHGSPGDPMRKGTGERISLDIGEIVTRGGSFTCELFSTRLGNLRPQSREGTNAQVGVRPAMLFTAE